MPPTNAPADTDLLIIGAGPTGLFAAYYAGFRGLRVAVVEPDRHAVALVTERERGPVEVVLGAGRRGLLDEAPDQVATLDAREARDVEDRLLGVHRGDLAAELGQ